MKLSEKIRDVPTNFTEKYSNLTLVAFILSTALMMYQHYLGWSWDFNVYSMIGQYLFHDGFYMEWLRPPVASATMGLLQFIVPQKISEYLFILISSWAFLYSSRRLSQSYEFDSETFYILILTPAAIFYSTMAGTEMLSLSFVMLFLADLDKPKTGLWLGLAFLTRYNYGLIIPLTLLQKDILKTVKTGIIAGLTLVPWLTYNFLAVGNPLASFGNFLMLNVFLRNINSPLALENFILVGLPSVLLLTAYLKPEVREKVSLDNINLFMISYTGLIALSYFTADLRSIRYLYPLIIPVAFYGEKVWKEIGTQKALTALLGLNIALGAITVQGLGMTDPGKYDEAEKFVGDCMAESESWVHLNYAGTPTETVSDKNISLRKLEKGYRSVTFKGPRYRNLSAPIIKETARFTIYGYEDRCAEQVKSDSTYIEGFNERTGLNYSFSSYMYNRFIQEKLEAYN